MPAGDVRRNPQTGDVYRLEQVGNDLQWIELDDDAAVIAERVASQSPAMAAAASFAENMTFGAVGPEPAQAAEYRSQSPIASMVGDAATFLPALGPLAAGRMGGRLAAKVAATAPQKAPVGADIPRRLIRRPSNILGRGTATGQAARLVEAGAEGVPGLNVPGMMQGALNQRRVNGYFAQAMGLSDDAVARARTGVNEVTPEVLKMFDDGYGSLKTGIDKGLSGAIAEDASSLIDEAAVAKMLKPQTMRSLARNEARSADEVLETMADLREYARAPNQAIQEIRHAEDLLERFDAMLDGALAGSDEASVALHKQLNSRYAVWRTMRKGRGISADGQIMPSSADGRFASQFGDQYMVGKAIKDPDVNAFLQVIREGAGLNVGLQSSGTAERLMLPALLGLGGYNATQ